ncbi:uncharacterized protein L201_004040 [Kwoniella dendrophila CBS 6074]|uniref:DUF7719 domain-containing protein n=1 Tax=Kwoniella dendrophila CBS 6074 TaxID=1295534 RepID=A0AAX4JUT1_9TREE
MAIVEEIPSSPNPTSASTSTARQRKNKKNNKSKNAKATNTVDPDDIPLKRPSEISEDFKYNNETSSNGNRKKPLIDMDLPENSNLFTLNPGETISEDHLNGNDKNGQEEEEVSQVTEEEEEEDEIFNTLIVAVPFTFLYLLLDILVHLQYNHRPTTEGLVKGCLTALPTNRYSDHWITNSFLMSSSIIAGCRMIWLVNKSSWSVVTSQAPPMGTLWILTIVQLPLSRAVLALLFVGVWIWWKGMKFMP